MKVTNEIFTNVATIEAVLKLTKSDAFNVETLWQIADMAEILVEAQKKYESVSEKLREKYKVKKVDLGNGYMQYDLSNKDFRKELEALNKKEIDLPDIKIKRKDIPEKYFTGENLMHLKKLVTFE